MICLLISVIVFGFVLWGFVQLFVALLLVYRGRARTRDVEQDAGEGSPHLSLARLVKHLLGAMAPSPTPQTGPSARTFAFKESDQVQLMN